MPECQLCKREVDMIFTCNYCKQLFCAEHRLPENHLCPGMPTRKVWRLRRSKLSRKQGYLARLGERFLGKKSLMGVKFARAI